VVCDSDIAVIIKILTFYNKKLKKAGKKQKIFSPLLGSAGSDAFFFGFWAQRTTLSRRFALDHAPRR